MKKLTIYTLGLIFLLLNVPHKTNAAKEDTTTIRTIEFDSRRIGWFDFLDNKDITYRKVVMNFLIKCPPGKQCGEWDYLSYVYIDHYYAPSFRLNGKSPNKAYYITDTAWKFIPILVDGNWTLEKTSKEAIKLELFDINSDEPTKSIETRYVWDLYYTYTIDENGNITDSTLVDYDEEILLSTKRVFFNDDVTLRDRFELMRYLTPYGNGLNLGAGWLYQIDVTDFLPLLQGKVFIYAPCGGWGDQTSNTDQESLQLTFDFIEGTPIRDIIRFEKMWTNHYAVYDGKFEEKFPPIEVDFAENEKGAKLKVIQTGHGFGGNQDNCAEFCKKEAKLEIDGIRRYAQDIWRECGDIPLYPQGGTWLIDRTNWCPGMDAEYHDYELTPYINPGSTHLVDYSMEYYNTPFTTGSNHIPYWVISSFLITYSAPNFVLDAEIVDIISPTTKQHWLRKNPACFGNQTIVRNSGKDEITEIKFKYGFVGDDEFQTFTWKGSLKFFDTTTVSFYNSIRTDDFSSPRKYYVEIISVNGREDDYSSNNYGSSIAMPTPVFPNDISFNLRTNNYASIQYTFIVRNSDKYEILKRTNLLDNTQYNFEMDLPDGCYEFELHNAYGYGLYFFFMESQLGRGSFNISSRGQMMRQFNPDFGNYLYGQFNVSSVPEAAISFDTLDFGIVDLNNEKEMTFEIFPRSNKPLTVKNMNIVFAAKWGFRIIESIPSLNNGDVVIQPGEKMLVKIGYKPTSAGTASTNLNISTNDFYSTEKQLRLVGLGKDPNSIFEVNNDYDLNIKHNNNILHIEVLTSASIGNTLLSIYDTMGNIVDNIYSEASANYYNTIDYNTSMLASGTYFVVMKSGNKMLSKPFIVAR